MTLELTIQIEFSGKLSGRCLLEHNCSFLLFFMMSLVFSWKIAQALVCRNRATQVNLGFLLSLCVSTLTPSTLAHFFFSVLVSGAFCFFSKDQLSYLSIVPFSYFQFVNFCFYLH
jgi:hypothetical protein